MIRNLAIVTHGYPYNGNRAFFPFVQQFAHAAARCGAGVDVVAPIPLHRALRSRDPFFERETAGEGVEVGVWRPRYLSLSCRKIGRFNTTRIGQHFFLRAVGGVVGRRDFPRPDAIYGHFLYRGGQAAVCHGERLGVPGFPMVGEGLLNTVDPFGEAKARRDFTGAAAFMSNSSCLGKMLTSRLGIDSKRIGVFPNGVDHRRFHPRDRLEMRRKFGLPEDRFIVICVGSFDVPKGPVRVGEAIRGLDGLGAVLIGAGDCPPVAEEILFKGRVPHSQIPEWLSAADVFVLPTEWEGCCNSILEAMACGLPVISSLGEFNDDILNDDVSIRVDPMDVVAIRAAIVKLRDDAALRRRMAEATLRWSERFDVDRRAQSMLEFMERWGGIGNLDGGIGLLKKS